MSDSKTPLKGSDKATITSLALICLAIIGYGFVFSQNTSSNFTYLLGGNTVYALIFWAVFNAAVGNKSNLNIKGISFLVILISLMSSSYIGAYNQKRLAKDMITRMQNDFTTVMESSFGEDGYAQINNKKIEIKSRAKGKLGEMERYVKTTLKDAILLQNNYSQELNSSGWDKIFDLERIQKDKSFSQSKTIIQKGKGVVEKYKKLQTSSHEKNRERIKSLNLTEKEKESMLKGFDRSSVKSKRTSKAIWDLEIKIISTAEKMFEFLSQKNGMWTIENDQILFSDDDDLLIYNSYITSMIDASKLQNTIQRGHTQEIINDTNKIKEKI